MNELDKLNERIKKEYKFPNKKGRSKTKIIIFGALFLVALMGVAYGIWAVFLTTDSTVSITSTSGNPIVFSTSFSDLNLDASSSAVNDSTVATIQNNDGVTDMIIDYAFDVQDVDDSCVYDEDASYSIELEGISLYNSGQEVSIPSGATDLTLSVGAVRWACPSTIQAQVNFTPSS